MFAACLILSIAPPALADLPVEQDPKPAAVPRQWSNEDASAAVRAFQKVFKKRKPSLRDRLLAIEALAAGSHKKLVNPLVKVIVSDGSYEVRKQAAEALARQPVKEASRAVLKLLGASTVKKKPAVLASLVTAFADCGYQPRHWSVIDGFFEKRYGPEFVPLQKALLGLIGKHKEKQAIDLLLRNMDEPMPVWVDDRANPPAEYWERRWKAWRAWRENVKEAMFRITGQRFSTAAEAENWLDENGSKIGIKRRPE